MVLAALLVSSLSEVICLRQNLSCLPLPGDILMAWSNVAGELS
jgi:hypothetical protein